MRSAILMAKALAESYEQSELREQHLLAGIVGSPDGPGTAALRAIGGNPASLAIRITSDLREADPEIVPDAIPFCASVREILTRAMSVRPQFGFEMTEADLLLYAVLVHNSPIAISLLEGCGVIPADATPLLERLLRAKHGQSRKESGISKDTECPS